MRSTTSALDELGSLSQGTRVTLPRDSQLDSLPAWDLGAKSVLQVLEEECTLRHLLSYLVGIFCLTFLPQETLRHWTGSWLVKKINLAPIKNIQPSTFHIMPLLYFCSSTQTLLLLPLWGTDSPDTLTVWGTHTAATDTCLSNWYHRHWTDAVSLSPVTACSWLSAQGLFYFLAHFRQNSLPAKDSIAVFCFFIFNTMPLSMAPN